MREERKREGEEEMMRGEEEERMRGWDDERRRGEWENEWMSKREDESRGCLFRRRPPLVAVNRPLTGR